MPETITKVVANSKCIENELVANIPDASKQATELKSISNEEKLSDQTSYIKEQQNFDKRTWDNKKDFIYLQYSDSMSFVNIIISLLLWAFLYFAISQAIGKVLGWILFGVCYIIYLIECTNCSIFRSILNRKHESEHVEAYISSFLNLTPMIAFAVNKLVAVQQEKSQENKQQQNDIESQNVYELQIQNKSNSNNQENQQSIQFQQESIHFEFEKVNYELININDLMGKYNSFKLRINSITKISDEYSQNLWSKKKEQFKQEQEQIKGTKIISTIQYTDFNNQKYLLYIKSSFIYHIFVLTYSFLSLIGLSILFRIFYNVSVPTIQAQLEKKLTC
ncbi:transmembrane protein, putative (macronuclear) [Tetrahymena thermophila SB210]|uniref:Transmembrane protein, putative n=1 Tax=Tetrahymena thermophila (strain SB210) TaxID=312017 RepID=Q240Q3_TETTS|nr:transmembrane protein, putative [Tetrahymena thermophila SB210]EAS02361.1 transmembrane protein, putative [Tetrahymena thermophila SB210]|eukprot:XP_001022606.1 transmembrane protein, putative [Tetrahymena thermophila SB210]